MGTFVSLEPFKCWCRICSATALVFLTVSGCAVGESVKDGVARDNADIVAISAEPADVFLSFQNVLLVGELPWRFETALKFYTKSIHRDRETWKVLNGDRKSFANFLGEGQVLNGCEIFTQKDPDRSFALLQVLNVITQEGEKPLMIVGDSGILAYDSERYPLARRPDGRVEVSGPRQWCTAQELTPSHAIGLSPETRALGVKCAFKNNVRPNSLLSGQVQVPSSSPPEIDVWHNTGRANAVNLAHFRGDGIRIFVGEKEHSFAEKDGLLSNQVSAAWVGKDEAWVGFFDSGIQVIKLKAKDVAIPEFAPKALTGVSLVYPWKELMLIGTFEKGLWYCDSMARTGGKFEAIPACRINDICVFEDVAYIATDRGIFRLSEKN